MDNKPPICGTI